MTRYYRTTTMIRTIVAFDEHWWGQKCIRGHPNEHIDTIRLIHSVTISDRWRQEFIEIFIESHNRSIQTPNYCLWTDAYFAQYQIFSAPNESLQRSGIDIIWHPSTYEMNIGVYFPSYCFFLYVRNRTTSPFDPSRSSEGIRWHIQSPSVVVGARNRVIEIFCRLRCSCSLRLFVHCVRGTVVTHRFELENMHTEFTGGKRTVRFHYNSESIWFNAFANDNDGESIFYFLSVFVRSHFLLLFLVRNGWR